MSELTHAASRLADIAHLLSSGHGANARIGRVLTALQRVVAYDRCALVNGAPAIADRAFVAPSLAPSAQEALCARAEALLALLSDRGEREVHQWNASGTAAHLAVPLASLDEVVGVLLVERDSGHYEPQDLQLLSVVASQLAAFLTMLNLHEDERRASEIVREVAERRTQFLGMLSHELRNPLAPMSTALEILERVAPDTDQAARARAIVGRQFAHLSRLVNDLLDATRVTSGKVHVERAPIDLADVVRRSAEDHQAIFGRAGVALEVRTPDAPVWVDGDPVRLAQVVGNLLANAAKFSSPGGTTAVKLGLNDGGVVLSIRDDGAGVAPGVLPRLFEPFAQGDETLDRSRGGLGLGLAVAKGLVELHGGTIEARSEGVGRGAEFTVRLPPLPVARAPAGAHAEVPGRSPARRRVLVVEDNLDAASSLRDLLQLYGHDVEVAHEGRGALARAASFKPDVVLCDIGLPGMSGYEVARAMRVVVNGGARLIALTGYGLDADRDRALEAGFDGHLVKPVTGEQLEEVLAAGVARP